MSVVLRVANKFTRRTAFDRILTAFGITDLDKLSRKGRQFGVISAYRAGLSKSENQTRHGQLMADLQRAGYHQLHTFKSQWDDMDTKVTHKEKSIFVPKVKFSDLVNLGNKYEQDAVLFKDVSGTIGIYFKNHTAIMAFTPTGDMAVTKSVNPDEDYSRGRGLSFGLTLIEDRTFSWSNGPVKPKSIAKALKEKPLS